MAYEEPERRIWCIDILPALKGRGFPRLIGDDVEHSGHYASGKIIFNQRQPLQQQRFSIAHQIGHHLAGDTLCPEESAQTFSTAARSAKEIQANNFALAVLIPGEHLRYAVLRANECDLKQLALHFGVSTVALQKRLQQIQLL